MEDLLGKSPGQGLDAFREQCNGRLESLVTLLRDDLSPVHRMTLSTLCVLDIHARDVVSQLESSKTVSKLDFSWQQQLRSYWREDDLYLECIGSLIWCL